VGQRYRILFRVERSIVTAVVVAAGIRKDGSREDIYRVAAKLIRLGLL
jgi:mRNA interferase RelE/StbE